MRSILFLLLVALIVLGSFSLVRADEEKVTRKNIAGESVTVTSAEAAKKDTEDSFLKGVNFGAGIMANFFTGSKKPVESARVVNGVVRVEEEGKGQVGVVAEFHTLWGIVNSFL